MSYLLPDAMCNNGSVEIADDILEWLLDSDPAVRWQVMRDLLDEAPAVYEAERARVAAQGWGVRLLDAQDPDGNWGGGVYNPKWVSTTYTLLSLRDLGLVSGQPGALRGCDHFLLGGFEIDGGINLFKTIHHSETCVNSMILALLSYFRHPGEDVHRVAEFLLGEQMPDGGWNCQWSSRSRGRATHASFNTTILALEAFAAYAGTYPAQAAQVGPAVARGQEFLFMHHLYRSHRTGRLAFPGVTRMAFPPRWHYDFLRGLDYLQSVDAAWDSRAQEAIDLLVQKRGPDGRWPLGPPWPARLFFEMEGAGAPSRWNTLRALRVLKWWEDRM